MVKIDLKGQVKEFDQGVTAAEVAKSIGMGLYLSLIHISEPTRRS